MRVGLTALCLILPSITLGPPAAEARDEDETFQLPPMTVEGEPWPPQSPPRPPAPPPDPGPEIPDEPPGPSGTPPPQPSSDCRDCMREGDACSENADALFDTCVDRLFDHAQAQCDRGLTVDGSEMASPWLVCDLVMWPDAIPPGKVDELDAPTTIVPPEEVPDIWEDLFVRTDDEFSEGYKDRFCRDITHTKCLAEHMYGIDDPAGGFDPPTINFNFGPIGLGVDPGPMSVTLSAEEGNNAACSDLTRQVATLCAIAEHQCQVAAECIGEAPGGGDARRAARRVAPTVGEGGDALRAVFASRWAAFVDEAGLDAGERARVLDILADRRTALAAGGDRSLSARKDAFVSAVERGQRSLRGRDPAPAAERRAERRLERVLDAGQMAAYTRWLGSLPAGAAPKR